MTPKRAQRTFTIGARELLSPLGLLVAVLAQSERLPLVAVVSVAATMACFVGLPGRHKQLTFAVQAPNVVLYVGDTLRVRLIVTNSGTRLSPPCTLTVDSSKLSGAQISLPELRPGEVVAVEQVRPLEKRRGPTEVHVHTQLHHRLVGKERKLKLVSIRRQALQEVRPRPVLPPASLVERLARPSDEGYGTGRRGNADPLSLRRFASGDPVSTVHWRSTARAGFPVVMEREQLASGVLVLLVAVNGSGDSWERSVARAAGLVQAAAEVGVPVQVFAAAPAAQLSGVQTLDAVQSWLAGLEEAGVARPELVRAAVRAAAGGLVAVLSAERSLADLVVEAGASPTQVVDLCRDPW